MIPNMVARGCRPADYRPPIVSKASESVDRSKYGARDRGLPDCRPPDFVVRCIRSSAAKVSFICLCESCDYTIVCMVPDPFRCTRRLRQMTNELVHYNTTLKVSGPFRGNGLGMTCWGRIGTLECGPTKNVLSVLVEKWNTYYTDIRLDRRLPLV